MNIKCFLCLILEFVTMAGYGTSGGWKCSERFPDKDLVVSNVNTWTTSEGVDGMVHTIGIVENKSNSTYYKARVRVIYLNAQGKPIDVEGWLSELQNELEGSMGSAVPADITSVETIMIAPKSKSYFHKYRSVTKLKGKVHNVKIEFERIDKMQPEFKMTVSNITMTPDVETKTIWDGTKVTTDNGMRVKGKMKNLDKAPADSPKLAILFYGADGKIWGDRIIDFTMAGLNSVKLSKSGSMEGNEEVDFDILCDHPMIDLNGKKVKISKVEVIGYKEISYF